MVATGRSVVFDHEQSALANSAAGAMEQGEAKHMDAWKEGTVSQISSGSCSPPVRSVCPPFMLPFAVVTRDSVRGSISRGAFAGSHFMCESSTIRNMEGHGARATGAHTQC
jgi:hypothetical protein